MQWELVVALVIAVPIILFPAAYIWYLNAGGIYALAKQAWQKRAVRKRVEHANTLVEQKQEYESALTEAMKRYPWQ